MKNTENIRYQLKMVASVLYNFIMEYFTEECLVSDGNIDEIKDEKCKPYPINETLPIKFDQNDKTEG